MAMTRAGCERMGEAVRKAGVSFMMGCTNRFNSGIGKMKELSDRKFAGPINGCEQLQPALGGLDLGDVHMKAPDWIALETLPLWCVPFDVRQAR